MYCLASMVGPSMLPSAVMRTPTLENLSLTRARTASVFAWGFTKTKALWRVFRNASISSWLWPAASASAAVAGTLPPAPMVDELRSAATAATSRRLSQARESALY